MAKYIWINREILEKANQTLSVDGIDLHVQLSPYDSPRSISGAYDEGRGVFKITFQYAGEEPRGSTSKFDDVNFIEGKYSGKLLEIAIPTKQKNIMIVSLETQVLNALKKRGESFTGLPTIGKKLNQDVAQSAIQKNFKELTGELVGA